VRFNKKSDKWLIFVSITSKNLCHLPFI
jgi:hypothetical protein